MVFKGIETRLEKIEKALLLGPDTLSSKFQFVLRRIKNIVAPFQLFDNKIEAGVENIIISIDEGVCKKLNLHSSDYQGHVVVEDELATGVNPPKSLHGIVGEGVIFLPTRV